MERTEKAQITVDTVVDASIDKVWTYWTTPAHIMHWNNASADWHTPRAENELKAGGTFNFRMEARDKSFGFDFAGTYNEVRTHEYIAYTLGDGRKVQIQFAAGGPSTRITETFQAEDANSEELQRRGWQAILDNFKKYTESH